MSGAVLPRLVAVARWLRKNPHSALAAIVLCVAVWAATELVDEAVYEKESQAVDERILLALRNPSDISDPVGPAWVEEVGRDLTALGGVAVQVLVVLAGGTYLALRRAYRTLILLLMSIGGGIALSILLKCIFNRDRPHLVPHGSWVYTSSFPSGHSMMSTITYLTLAVMLARIESRLHIKAFLIFVAVGISCLVGISRVYLGVHWPTDVLAGWSMGTAWALLCSVVMRELQRRGQVETADATAAASY